MVKLACIDRDRESQQALTQFLQSIYTSCRETMGHTLVPEFYPAFQEEVEINPAPDAVVVGWQGGVEASYRVCKSVKVAHPDVPIFVFFEDTDFSLRNLNRFQAVSDFHFKRSAEEPQRFIHQVNLRRGSGRHNAKGKLVVVAGVKGGVGATSIVSGLAHAGDALGSKSIIVDLSAGSVFAFYAGAESLHSLDYRSALIHSQEPDLELVAKCTSQAPNGLNLLLPPMDGVSGRSDGSQLRELWVRDPERFETTLRIIELLQQMYDCVLVDLAGTEGVLSFALRARADTQLLVSSNEPASVHLLSRWFAALGAIGYAGRTRILINSTESTGISFRDVKELLSLSEYFEPEMASLPCLAYDKIAGRWIGTGNSFYTEGSRGTRRCLAAAYSQLIEAAQSEVTAGARPVMQRLLGVFRRGFEARAESTPPALPQPDFSSESSAEGPLVRPSTAQAASSYADERELITQEISDLYTPPALSSANGSSQSASVGE